MRDAGKPIQFEHVAPGYVTLRDEELSALIKQAVEDGASAALARVGLGDEGAAKDLRDMRDWLAAWRAAKNTAWSTIISTIIRAILVVFFLGVAFKLGLKIPDGGL